MTIKGIFLNGIAQKAVLIFSPKLNDFKYIEAMFDEPFSIVSIDKDVVFYTPGENELFLGSIIKFQDALILGDDYGQNISTPYTTNEINIVTTFNVSQETEI